jgi:hypothetical protein
MGCNSFQTIDKTLARIMFVLYGDPLPRSVNDTMVGAYAEWIYGSGGKKARRKIRSSLSRLGVGVDF